MQFVLCATVDGIFRTLSECAAMNPDPCDEMLATADGDFFYDSEQAWANVNIGSLDESMGVDEINTGQGDLEDVSR